MQTKKYSRAIFTLIAFLAFMPLAQSQETASGTALVEKPAPADLLSMQSAFILRPIFILQLILISLTGHQPCRQIFLLVYSFRDYKN